MDSAYGVGNPTSPFCDAVLYRAQRGDKHALDAIYPNLCPVITTMAKARCWSLGLDASYVEDIVQTTLLYVLDPTRTRYNPARGNTGQYLRGLVWNAAKAQLPPNWLQKLKIVFSQDNIEHFHIEGGGDAGAGDPAEICEILDFQSKAVKRAVEILAQGEQHDVDIVYLHAVEKRPFTEIAKLTGISRFKVSRRYDVAIADLQQGLLALA